MMATNQDFQLPNSLAFLRYVAETLDIAFDPAELDQLRTELRKRLSTTKGLRSIIGLTEDCPPMTMPEMLAELVIQAMAAHGVYGTSVYGRALRPRSDGSQ
jgi:hypothetical protein